MGEISGLDPCPLKKIVLEKHPLKDNFLPLKNSFRREQLGVCFRLREKCPLQRNQDGPRVFSLNLSRVIIRFFSMTSNHHHWVRN